MITPSKYFLTVDLDTPRRFIVDRCDSPEYRPQGYLNIVTSHYYALFSLLVEFPLFTRNVMFVVNLFSVTVVNC